MKQNIELIRKFYGALAKKDIDTMLACYHIDLHFKDPVIGSLGSEGTRFMWRILLAETKIHELSIESEWADEHRGGVTWEAKYEYGPEKRIVHNTGKSIFYFEDGQIVEHRDSFNFWKWSRMAMGTLGTLLGWSPFLRQKIRKDLKARVQNFKIEQSYKAALNY